MKNFISKAGAKWFFCLLASVLLFASDSYAQAADSEAIAARMNYRKSHLTAKTSNLSARGGLSELAEATCLTDEAVRFQAKQKNIVASKDEVYSMLIQVLGKNGIIDITNPPADLQTDPNVKIYLESQQYPYKELQYVGETLVLWTKLMTAGIQITAQDIEQYLQANPSAGIVPERVQIKISAYIEPPKNNGTRGSTWSFVAPSINLSSRSSLDSAAVKAPEAWKGMSLFLPLENLEPRLRMALSNKKAGDSFGAVRLDNGAIIAGKVERVVKEFDINDLPYFLNWLPLHVALSKVQKAESAYEEMVNQYLAKGPTRGWSPWSGLKKIGGYVWKKAPYVTAAVGAGVGAYYGGWQGAVAGGRLGYNMGTKTQQIVNNFRGSGYNLSSIPRFDPRMMQQMYSNMPQNVSYTPPNYNQYYQQFMGYNPYAPYGQNGYAPPGYGQPMYPQYPPMYLPQPIAYY